MNKETITKKQPYLAIPIEEYEDSMGNVTKNTYEDLRRQGLL